MNEAATMQGGTDAEAHCHSADSVGLEVSSENDDEYDHESPWHERDSVPARVQDASSDWVDRIPEYGWVSTVLVDMAGTIAEACTRNGQEIDDILLTEVDDGDRVHIGISIGGQDANIDVLKKTLVGIIVPACRMKWRQKRAGPKSISIEVMHKDHEDEDENVVNDDDCASEDGRQHDAKEVKKKKKHNRRK